MNTLPSTITEWRATMKSANKAARTWCDNQASESGDEGWNWPFPNCPPVFIFLKYPDCQDWLRYYFFSIYKLQYAKEQIPENRFIAAAADPSTGVLHWPDMAMLHESVSDSSSRWLRPVPYHPDWNTDSEMTEDEQVFDAWLVEVLVHQWCIGYPIQLRAWGKQGTPAQAREARRLAREVEHMDEEERRKLVVKVAQFVDFFKGELQPGAWEDSALPDLLGLRVLGASAEPDQKDTENVNASTGPQG